MSPEFIGAKSECLRFLIDYTEACIEKQATGRNQAHLDVRRLTNPNPLDPTALQQG
jgi:hypothetical protein